MECVYVATLTCCFSVILVPPNRSCSNLWKKSVRIIDLSLRGLHVGQQVSPIAVYTSGKGSSAAGLTASVQRDSNTVCANVCVPETYT